MKSNPGNYNPEALKAKTVICNIHKFSPKMEGIDELKQEEKELQAIKPSKLSKEENKKRRKRLKEIRELKEKAAEDACFKEWENLGDTFFDLVIVDESHHFPANTWNRLCNFFKKVNVVFLTATPMRSDKKNMLKDSDVVYRYTRKNAIKDKVIRDTVATYTKSKAEVMQTVVEKLLEKNENNKLVV